MNKEIKKVLNKIEKEGYEAYIVGGFVRDKILNRKSLDVDICTNALPKDIHSMFVNNTFNNYGGINIKINKFNIDITTYRQELRYEGRKPVEIKYINNLIDDLKRRDFTVNTLCMNQNGKIIDLLDGKADIKKRLLKIVGDPDKKLSEDPLRILRAIRFACVLNFNIDDNLKLSIINNASYVKTLSNERVREELNKILLSKNFYYGITLLKELNIAKELDITFNNVKYSSDLYVMYSQLNISEKYFTKNEINTINKIKEIIKYGKIDYMTLYNYGLYLCMMTGETMGYTHSGINKVYKTMELNESKPLDIKSDEIIKILNIEPGIKIKEIQNEITNKILEGKLKNNNKELKKYLLNRVEV